MTYQPKPAIDAEHYNAFIRHLKLHNILVISASMETTTPFWEPDPRHLHVDFEAIEYRQFPDEPRVFAVHVNTRVDFLNPEHTGSLAFVQVAHNLVYSSAIPIDDAIFQHFRDPNIKLHAWPFVREFIHSSVTRFGWAPFTLPTYAPHA